MGGWGAHGRGSGCGLREFRASADARVPFPQGKGTKGCRRPARIPCGAPAPGPPSDKRLVSVEPRRGAPDGVPSGSALTAPLKTFRFQRGPVLREGKAMRRRTCFACGSLSAWSAYKKASPERGGARKAGGGVRSPAPQGRGGSVSRRDHNHVYRRTTALAGGTKPEERRTSSANCSSGEGVWGRGASLREAASPPESPHCKSLREGARGRGLL